MMHPGPVGCDTGADLLLKGGKTVVVDLDVWIAKAADTSHGSKVLQN